jgi:hypothetical protein
MRVNMLVVATFLAVKVVPPFEATVKAPMPKLAGTVVALPAGFQNAILLRAKSGCSAVSRPEGPTNAGIALLAISRQKMVTLSAGGAVGVPELKGIVIPAEVGADVSVVLAKS